MKCEWVQDNILLYVYDELADDARYELEQHLARCTDCAAELKASRHLHTTLSSLRVEDPSPNLLTASRMQLQETLETTEQGGFWQRLIFDPAAWLRPIRFAPALAAAIFIVGLQVESPPHTRYWSIESRDRNFRTQHLLSPPSAVSVPFNRIPTPTGSASSTTRFPPKRPREH